MELEIELGKNFEMEITKGQTHFEIFDKHETCTLNDLLTD